MTARSARAASPACLPAPWCNYYLPVYENGKWDYSACTGRVLDKSKFEAWKTRFYDFEGWNESNGWPKRSTLEGLGLEKVADTLQSKRRLG